DDAEGYAAAAVHGHAGRLVDDHQVLVLEDHRKHRGRRPARLVALGQAQRRHAHQIAVLQAVVAADAALVDPHLAAANGFVDVAFGHPFALTQQEVVDALTRPAFVDAYHPHLGGWSL